MRVLPCFSLATLSLLGNLLILLGTAQCNMATYAVMEFAKFHLLEKDFLISGRPSQISEHKVVFAVKQNTEQVESILLEVSDPRSEYYGQHLSRDQVSQVQ